MASDASRRWLDDSGIWSCRIKLPQSQNDNSRLLSDNTGKGQSQLMAAVDAVLEPGSPSSRRNKGKIAEAIQSLSNLNSGMESLELPTDPDAQATVTDFLDFTEYLPADMIRSLTLIGNLDQIHINASTALNDLTKRYGKLPEMPAEKRPDAVELRATISEEVSQVVSARTLAHAEAIRMDDNIERHCIRAKNILAKLLKMAEEYPTSREGTPKLDSPELIRTMPKVPLRVEGMRVSRKHRAPRITVPGEVLAPYELDYESWESDSDSADSDDGVSRILLKSSEPPVVPGLKKLKLNIIKKDKKEKSAEQKDKAPRGPRPPGAMGTNVHSAVAGISTSNALAKLKPPPPDAEPGDEHLPWLALNPYELATLRKRMKKNAIWSPSDTMIARELATLGRGYENYMNACREAEKLGATLPVPPQLRGEVVQADGAISIEALKLKDNKLVNRGMKLNEAKKIKKENMAKQAAEEAALEAEAAAHKMTTLKSNMANMFVEQNAKAKTPTPKAPPKSVGKKRKRESPVPEEIVKPIPGMPILAAKPAFKRSKTETPVPVPQTIFAKQVSPLNPPESVLSTASPAPTLTPAAESAPELLAPPATSPRKSSTPILPPTKELRKIVKKEVKAPEPLPNTRSKRSDDVVVPAPIPVLAPEPLPAKRPSSSRSKKASEEPGTPQVAATSDRPRRTSTARNTPAPPEPHKMNRRTKRPPPGILSTESEGSTAVSKRSKATRKKAGAKKEKKDDREGSMNHEIFEEVDDDGNPIDPNEPRYCLCNRVSFGTMIECDNKDCEKEWFHLECVDLTQVPGKTTKWYCPECRGPFNTDPNGEVPARGKKK